MRYILLVLSLTMALVASALAAERFVISDIRVEGLQRISADSVFAAMPVSVGDTVDAEMLAGTARTLFGTGNFDDIQLGREDNVLVVRVQERPSISEINIEGNEAIETEALLMGLRDSGLAEGQVLRRATLEGMRMELTRQYVSQGRYDASIETEVVAQPRNRVVVNINIDEGSTASIKHLNLVGNEVFSDSELKGLFELGPKPWYAFFSNRDQYGRERLRGDLESLESYYLDQGYIQFGIDSTQVAVSPDRESVFLTINVDEGEQFTVSSVALSGDVVLPEEDLERFLMIGAGDTFSQAQVTRTEELMVRRLGNEGYNFARVSGLTEVDEENREVALRFFIEPGKRTYVRRINFRGNHRTGDEVLRREMRQLESAPASSANIELSRVRLERLGYFREAQVNTHEVPGTDDLIDLEFAVEEQSTGSLSASLGYAQDSGLLLGANIQQNNFMGTGNQVGVGVSRSRFQTSVNFNYLNPYYTEDGVSRGFSVFYRETDLEEINIASFTTNTIGGSVDFGYPISETQRLNFSLGYSNTEIKAGIGAVEEIRSSPRLISGVNHFIEPGIDPATGDRVDEDEVKQISQLPPGAMPERSEPGFLDRHGNRFNNFTVTGSWRYSTLDRGILATRGASQSVSLELSVPGSDAEYYKLMYNGQKLFPLGRGFTLRFRTRLGYGDGYGDVDELPFFEHFFAGGFNSVRGFRSNTLGPRSTPPRIFELSRPRDEDGATRFDEPLSYVRDPDTGELRAQQLRVREDPFGGNILTEGSMELLVPLPFVPDPRSVRAGFFVDVGNVFSNNCRSTQRNCTTFDVSELRYSTGFGVTWITGFGPLSFSLAQPLNDKSGDRTEVFQFSIGRTF